jgi:cysteine synthase A
LQARRNAVAELLSTIPRSWTPDQYANRLNPLSHTQTMKEILDDLGSPPTALFVAASTTGTLQGCQQHLQSVGAGTTVIAVDAVGSVLFGGDAGPRLMPGFGAGSVPPLADRAAPHAVVRVDEIDCVRGCRRLASAECLLVGASGGGVVTALERELARFGAADRIVLVVHDGGERYLDTVHDDGWVAVNLGCDVRLLAGGVAATSRVA